MHVVSIMNYSDSDVKHSTLCCIWLDMLFKTNPDVTLTILHTGTLINNGIIMKTISKYPVNLETKDSDANEFTTSSQKYNLFFKLFNLTKITPPFLYIDADAIVFDSLLPLWELRSEKPFIAINHQSIPNVTDKYPPFLNGGVQLIGTPLVDNPDVYNYKKIITLYQQSNKQSTVPGTEQPALYNYFKSIGYNYSHPSVGFEWNASATTTTVVKTDLGYALKFKNSGTPAVINHYWADYRPWNISCPLWGDYANKT